MGQLLLILVLREVPTWWVHMTFWEAPKRRQEEEEEWDHHHQQEEEDFCCYYQKKILGETIWWGPNCAKL